MDNNMLKVPYFAKASSYEVLQQALQEGGVLEDLDRIAYIITTDTNKLYHISIDKIIRPISGDEEYVKNLDELPSVSEGKPNVIYIVNGIGYQFNEGRYDIIFDKKQVDELEAAVSADSEIIHDKLVQLESDLNDLSSTVDGFNDRIEAVEATATEMDDDVEQLTSFVESSLASFTDTLNDYNDRITTSESSILAITGQVNAAQTNISNLQLNMGTVQNTVDSH